MKPLSFRLFLETTTRTVGTIYATPPLGKPHALIDQLDSAIRDLASTTQVSWDGPDPLHDYSGGKAFRYGEARPRR